LILVPIAIPLFSTKSILKNSQSKIGEIPYPDNGKFNLIYIFVVWSINRTKIIIAIAHDLLKYVLFEFRAFLGLISAYF